MLIGTAGHIDHGKTTLVRALTGVDADRLPEEKQRGITVDLGYAYTELADGSVLGFIDVPGHEKLIHNMLAGALAIDFVLHVIAADDGPMPQTREHLELLDLLEMRHGAVALTKIDAVSAARLQEVHQEIHELLQGTALSGCPRFEVSALTGEGLDALRSHLENAANNLPARRANGRFRLAIDRSFSLKGVGTVVTGTAHAGMVSVGDSLVLSPCGLDARVRELHVQDRPAESGSAGERCALALKGSFEKRDVKRGMWLVHPGLHVPVSRFQAELHVPSGQQAVKHMQTIHLHLGTEDIVGRVALLDCRNVEPGGNALVEILLQRETPALRGDRFILRDAGAQRTVAGGRVLDIFPPTRHKRTPQRLDLLDKMRNDDPSATLHFLAAQSLTGVNLQHFALAWNLDGQAATALWRDVGLQVCGKDHEATGVSPATWERLRAKLLDSLEEEHIRSPDMIGVEPQRLRRMISAGLSRSVFETLCEQMLAAGAIAQTRTWLHLPTHRVSISADDRAQFADLQPLLDRHPYNPPRVRDIANATGIAESEVRQLFKRLARVGQLYPIAHDHYFTADAVAELADIVSRLNAEHGAARAAVFRDILYPTGGGGRKMAIRILEFFDRVGYTRRVEDDHVLRSQSTTHAWATS